MPGVPCGYRSNYLTIAGLILLTTGAARCEACTAEHWDRGWQSRLGSGCAWHFSVCLALCSYRPCNEPISRLSPTKCPQTRLTNPENGRQWTARPLTSYRCNYGLKKISTHTHTRVRASWIEFNNCPTICDLFSLLYFCRQDHPRGLVVRVSDY